MEALVRIERALNGAVATAEVPSGPPRLAAAMRHAVFPRGARVRPRLCLAVARACGEDVPALTDAAAAAIELLHCASLVHDDMPCFDDAATRRGKATVHRAFGEPLALLAGDALIVLAFDALARAGILAPSRLPPLTLIVARAVGAPSGIAAGQAWECEDAVDLTRYHRTKTAALFAAATMAGAASAGAEAEPWRDFGERIGEAYQVADDIRDVAMAPEDMGKPAGQDAALGRPSAVAMRGLAGAVDWLHELADGAAAAVPACAGANELRGLIRLEVMRLLPEGLSRRAA